MYSSHTLFISLLLTADFLHKIFLCCQIKKMSTGRRDFIQKNDCNKERGIVAIRGRRLLQQEECSHMRSVGISGIRQRQILFFFFLLFT